MDLQDRTGDSSNFCIADVCAGISGGLLRITIKNEPIQENDFCISSFLCLFCFWIVRHLVTIKDFFSIQRRDGHRSEKFIGNLIQFFSSVPVEHYISPEGLKGIENFLQYGDVYDRVYDDMDLYTFYEDGEFPMAFGLYEPERRNPRFLAPEYGKLEHSIILRVKKSQNCFLLKTKKDESIGYVWYRREDEWIQAKEEKGVYQLPTDVCTYTANTGIPITEAVAIIAITRFDQKPLPIDYRELNIHVW